MSEKQFIDRMTRIGYKEAEAEDMFDFYLSIDCADNLNVLALIGEIPMGLQEGHK